MQRGMYDMKWYARWTGLVSDQTLSLSLGPMGSQSSAWMDTIHALTPLNSANADLLSGDADCRHRVQQLFLRIFMARARTRGATVQPSDGRIGQVPFSGPSKQRQSISSKSVLNSSDILTLWLTYRRHPLPWRVISLCSILASEVSTPECFG